MGSVDVLVWLSRNNDEEQKVKNPVQTGFSFWSWQFAYGENSE